MSPIFVIVFIMAVASAQFESPPSGSPSQDCGPNEFFNMCGSACPKTCSNQREARTCPMNCVVKCDCMPGYVRHETSNMCVLPDEC